jgi:hypothetical protein
MILAVIALVTERPDDDGDVVSQPVNKLLCSVDVGVFPFPNEAKSQVSIVSGEKRNIKFFQKSTHVLLDVHCEAP